MIKIINSIISFTSGTLKVINELHKTKSVSIVFKGLILVNNNSYLLKTNIKIKFYNISKNKDANSSDFKIISPVLTVANEEIIISK